MTIRRYSLEEALRRILLVLEGKIPGDDAIGVVEGQVEGWDTTLSKIAELLQNSLPEETLTLPIYTSMADEHVYAYLTTGTSTSIPTGSLFYPVQGPFINNPITGFSLGATAIQYDGDGPKDFEIIWATSLYSDGGNHVLHAGVAINDEILSTSGTHVMGTFMKSGEPIIITGVRIVSLNTGDTVQLQITSEIDADTLQVEHFTTSIKRFL